MQEEFLHYIWQFQKFERKDLITTDGEPVSIFQVGYPNTDAGPDFQGARVQIGKIQWAGQVEIHVKSSFWKSHGHQKDPAYDNVVLHVVWEDNVPLVNQDGDKVPTIELKGRVPLSLVDRYQALMGNLAPVPCAAQIKDVPGLVKISMLDKSLLYRLERKAGQITETWLKAKDWEATAYQVMARNFGFKTNADAFWELSKALPLKILQKHADKPFQVEALLFGSAGFLEDDLEDEYTSRLKREYRFLRHKYQLQNQQLPISQWKFLRLRPANFPTVRIAQFAALISSQSHFFSKILYTKNLKELLKFFSIQQSDHWRAHYSFGKKAKQPVAGLGAKSIENMVINTVAPLLVAYGKHKDEPMFTDRAISFLEELHPEANRIIDLWKEIGLSAQHAADSQAMLELYHSFCTPKKCLQCNIGVNILKG